MADSEKTLKLFTTRVRQLIIQYKNLKQQNEELYEMVDGLESQIKQLKSQIEQQQNDYNSLKMAKMLSVTGNDVDTAKTQVAKLIRDVNKCITLLSEQESINNG